MKRLALLGLFALVLFSFALPSASAKRESCVQRNVRIGHWGKCPLQAKWLLGNHKPSVFHGSKYYTLSPHKGRTYTIRDSKLTRIMKKRLGWPLREINGVFGPILRSYLLGETRRPIAYRTRSGNRRIAWEKAQKRLRAKTPSARMRAVIRDALYLIAHPSRIYYSQQNRSNIYRHGRLPRAGEVWGEDCSSSVLGLLALHGIRTAGTPWGWTGTISDALRHSHTVWRRGQPLSRLKPGDLILYGAGGHPWTHVVLYLGNGRVFSQGSDNGPYNLPVYYRYDAGIAVRP